MCNRPKQFTSVQKYYVDIQRPISQQREKKISKSCLQQRNAEPSCFKSGFNEL